MIIMSVYWFKVINIDCKLLVANKLQIGDPLLPKHMLCHSWGIAWKLTNDSTVPSRDKIAVSVNGTYSAAVLI